jgi:hypothetical protein
MHFDTRVSPTFPRGLEIAAKDVSEPFAMASLVDEVYRNIRVWEDDTMAIDR